MLQIMRLYDFEFFGERALLYNEPRAASVVACGPLEVVSISREGFERLLGPLASHIQQHAHKREQAQKERLAQLDKLGLLNPSPQTFKIMSASNALPCGALYLVQHNASETMYSLRHESKKAIADAQEGVRVGRELTLLRDLANLQVSFMMALCSQHSRWGVHVVAPSHRTAPAPAPPT